MAFAIRGRSVLRFREQQTVDREPGAGSLIKVRECARRHASANPPASAWTRQKKFCRVPEECVSTLHRVSIPRMNGSRKPAGRQSRESARPAIAFGEACVACGTRCTGSGASGCQGPDRPETMRGPSGLSLFGQPRCCGPGLVSGINAPISVGVSTVAFEPQTGKSEGAIGRPMTTLEGSSSPAAAASARGRLKWHGKDGHLTNFTYLPHWLWVLDTNEPCL
jgi:hypothetical protein